MKVQDEMPVLDHVGLHDDMPIEAEEGNYGLPVPNLDRELKSPEFFGNHPRVAPMKPRHPNMRPSFRPRLPRRK